MSEPEIARRCTACGVSVRDRAMFCPQCGNPITQASPAAVDPTFEAAPTQALDSPHFEAAPTQALDSVPPPAVHKRHDEGVLARVEKFRKVSSVMIDQAAYDPSLRFLLVAAALFLIFLVLLILSKVIG